LALSCLTRQSALFVYLISYIYPQVRDENADPAYSQDMLQSVKRLSANQINKLENRSGTLWHNESFNTTIRDELHLYNAINYTLENPVRTGLVENWWEWKGTKLFF